VLQLADPLRRTTMEHILPALPYAMDALQPHMSKETFEKIRKKIGA